MGEEREGHDAVEEEKEGGRERGEKVCQRGRGWGEVGVAPTCQR